MVEGCHVPVHIKTIKQLLQSTLKVSHKSLRLTSAGWTKTDSLISSSPNCQQKSQLGAPSVSDENITQNQNSSSNEIQAILATLNKTSEIKTMLPPELLKYRGKSVLKYRDASWNLFLL